MQLDDYDSKFCVHFFPLYISPNSPFFISDAGRTHLSSLALACRILTPFSQQTTKSTISSTDDSLNLLPNYRKLCQSDLSRPNRLFRYAIITEIPPSSKVYHFLRNPHPSEQCPHSPSLPIDPIPHGTRTTGTNSGKKSSLSSIRPNSQFSSTCVISFISDVYS